MLERRRCSRQPTDVFFNKFLDGHPYLCRAVELSENGLLAATFVEPSQVSSSFPIELRLPGDLESLWVWVRAVRREGTLQALEFLRMSEVDRQRLEQHLASAA